ncbi:Nucleotide-binding alpha-beta plait domain [Phytophthora cactorum]|nr:Nucleotide-binding alpha-beta plait domain [Phytophthora cactorum]
MVSDVDSDSPGACDVCGTTAAALRCEACRLDLCISCSRRFHFYRQAGHDQEDDSPSTASPPNSPAAEELRQSSETTTSDALWGFDDALAQSIRALTFATDEETTAPRSFSDYATLGDAERWRAQGELSDLWDAMRTDFASRHVVVRCGAGSWTRWTCAASWTALTYHATRVDCGGLLFCTFFDLTSAVAAVDRWRANADIISFCLPYELPDDVNSATLLVRFALGGSPPTAAELRHVCTCFGQVAIAKYIVEYGDSRALPAALNALPRAFHASGPLSVARTTPPTLDVSKLKLFQECLNRAAATHPRVTRTRPKSFSSSSTSLLTSPTSSVASSLNASFLEGAGNNSPMASTAYPGAGELTSPVLMPQEEQQIWARPAPRARSNSSSAYLGGSLSSSSFGDSRIPAGLRFRRPAALARCRPSSNQLPTEQQQQSYYDFQRRQRMQTKFAPMRSSFSNNDHFIRTSAASSGGHASAHAGAPQEDAPRLGGTIKVPANKRTTLMIRNIPNKYTQQMLLSEINRHHRGNYDFFYLPIDFKNKCNMGYAFINFIEAAHIEAFHKEFDGQKWTNFNSEKGKQAMIARFQNSSLLDKHESYRPLVFGSCGPNRGKPEPFPAPKQIVTRSRMFGADEYGSYVAHRMYAQQPSQQQMQQQHSLAVYPQQLVGMPPLPTANGLHFGMQALPLQYIPSYQQHDPNWRMPSTALDYTL